MAKKEKFHLSKCAFCDQRIPMREVIVVTIHLKNTGPHADLVPTNDNMVCVHRGCLQRTLTPTILGLLPAELGQEL